MTVRVRDQNPCCLIAYNQLIHPVLFKIVATLERDFEQTVAYYALDGVARELLRTTSLLERTNRELRRKFGQVCCFGSPRGAEVAIYLQVKRLNARWSKQTWWETSHSLYFDFLNLDP